MVNPRPFRSVSSAGFLCFAVGLSQLFESVCRQPGWGHNKFDRMPCRAASGSVMMRNGPWDAIRKRSSQTDRNNILWLEVQGQVSLSWVVNSACQKSHGGSRLWRPEVEKVEKRFGSGYTWNIHQKQGSKLSFKNSSQI